jgi:hypothetical protein
MNEDEEHIEHVYHINLPKICTLQVHSWIARWDEKWCQMPWPLFRLYKVWNSSQLGLVYFPLVKCCNIPMATNESNEQYTQYHNSTLFGSTLKCPISYLIFPYRIRQVKMVFYGNLTSYYAEIKIFTNHDLSLHTFHVHGKISLKRNIAIYWLKILIF